MSETAYLYKLQELAVFQLIAESSWVFPSLETAHVAAISLVLGSILLVDLRLLGVMWRGDHASDVAAWLLPFTWTGFFIAALSGVLMFGSSAVRYAGNPAFLIKLILLGSAGLNMVVFHRFSFQRVAEWGRDFTPPLAARIAATLSIILWLAILICGRWIGFI